MPAVAVALEWLAVLVAAGVLPSAVAVACGVDGARGWLAGSLVLGWALIRRAGSAERRDGSRRRRGPESPTMEA